MHSEALAKHVVGVGSSTVKMEERSIRVQSAGLTTPVSEPGTQPFLAMDDVPRESVGEVGMSDQRQESDLRPQASYGNRPVHRMDTDVPTREKYEGGEPESNKDKARASHLCVTFPIPSAF